MKSPSTHRSTSTTTAWTTLAASLVIAIAAAPSVWAKQGATDAIPGTSNGAAKSGGSKKSTTPVVPVPALPPVSFYTSPLTFTASGPVNGVVPVCTGSYHVDPYYPTLSLMTVDVSTSSLNVPDGTVCYISVSGTGGTLYPFTSNAIVVTAGAGVCSHSEYLTPGTTVTGVTVTDAAGNVLFTGK